MLVLTYSFSKIIKSLANAVIDDEDIILEVPPSTFQASTGHRSFSSVVGKGEEREGNKLVAICNLGALDATKCYTLHL